MAHVNGISVRIDREVYNEALRVRKPNKRDIKSQVSFWTTLGRYTDENPLLTGIEVKKMVIEDGLRKQESYSEGNIT